MAKRLSKKRAKAILDEFQSKMERKPQYDFMDFEAYLLSDGRVFSITPSGIGGLFESEKEAKLVVPKFRDQQQSFSYLDNYVGDGDSFDTLLTRAINLLSEYLPIAPEKLSGTYRSFKEIDSILRKRLKENYYVIEPPIVQSIITYLTATVANEKNGIVQIVRNRDGLLPQVTISDYSFDFVNTVNDAVIEEPKKITLRFLYDTTPTERLFNN